jgi:hypothetical protein
MSMNISDFARQGQVFNAATQTSIIATALSTSTATGFVLSNPWGSAKNFLIYEAAAAASISLNSSCQVVLGASTAASSVPVTHTTPVVIRAGRHDGGSGNSAAFVDNSCVTPNLPVLVKVLPGGMIATATVLPTFYSKIDGALILVPGTFIQFSFIGNAPTCIYSMTWAEVPQF